MSPERKIHWFPFRAPIVERLELDATVFEGPSNAYLYQEQNSGSVSLIDTGVSTAAVADQLRRELSKRGLTFADIDHVLLTHFHYDHAGLAGQIQADSDATVWCHHRDSPLVAAGQDGIVELFAGDEQRLREWGIPAAERDDLRTFLRSTAGLAGQPVETTDVTDGDHIEIGAETVTVIHLPGHTAGHVGYRFSDGIMATGDVVLADYTPNVGGADIRLEHPLQRYFASLEALLSFEPDCLKPGHGDPITDPSNRIQRIIDHHQHRANQIIEILLETGPSRPWDVALALFGDLANIHILQGTGEAYAHLDFLLSTGHLSVDNGRYHVVNSDISPGFPQFS